MAVWRIPDFSLPNQTLALIPRARGARCLTTGHHLEQHPAEIFRLRQGREDGMIERLLETPQAPGRATRVDQGIGNHFLKNLTANMMRAGKSRQDSVRRKELESADVQLLVAAQGVMQAAFVFREGRRIEDDQV